MKKIIILLMVVCAFTGVKAQVIIVDDKGTKITIAPYTISKNLTRDSAVLSDGIHRTAAKDTMGAGSGGLPITPDMPATFIGIGDANNKLSGSANLSMDYNSRVFKVGNYAGSGATGNSNTYIGEYSGYQQTGTDNNFIGSNAGNKQTGNHNNFFGFGAGSNNPFSYVSIFGLRGVASANNQLVFSSNTNGTTNAQFDFNLITADRKFSVPDKSGTLALLSDITGGGGTYVETDPIVRAINGLVKSDGLNISAASPIYDYLQPNGSANALTNFPQFPESQITNLVTDLGRKQATLISGTNISTINGQSLLNGGDIVVGGGGGESLTSPSVVIVNVPQEYYFGNETNILINPLTSSSSLNIHFPASPLDGKIFTVRFGGRIAYGVVVVSILNFQGEGGQSVYGALPAVPGGSLNAKAGDFYSFRYELSNNFYYFTKTN